MTTAPSPVIVLHELSHDWPDGTVALDRLTGSFGTGRTGLVGANGSGKSTLLRILAGELRATSGRVEAPDDVGYLPQTLTLARTTTVADLLGVSAALAGLRAIEAGAVEQRHFDAVGEDWDVEARADRALHEVGLTGADLERPVRNLSGGEATLVAVIGLRLRGAPVTLLDEPTNNLDRDGRARLAGLVDAWPGALVVVSHDIDLLERMDQTAELHDGRLEVFGGPYGAWLEHREREQAAARQAVRTAEQALATQRRQRAEAETRIARRARAGRARQRSGDLPPILAGARMRRAQESAGALRTGSDAHVREAREQLDAAEARVRDDGRIRLDLPDPDVPRGRRLAEFDVTGPAGARTVVLQGPERVAVVGPNGSGKTTLLDHLVLGRPARPGGPTGRLLTDRVGYLPQRLDGLDDAAGAVENVRAAAPGATAGAIRDRLARMLLRGDAVDRPVGALSGGERFRVALARLLSAEPPVQLLVLDEPTNNLDLVSVEHLLEALAGYRGAVLVASHDDRFLARLDVTAALELDRRGQCSWGELTPRRVVSAQARASR